MENGPPDDPRRWRQFDPDAAHSRPSVPSVLALDSRPLSCTCILNLRAEMFCRIQSLVTKTSQQAIASHRIASHRIASHRIAPRTRRSRRSRRRVDAMPSAPSVPSPGIRMDPPKKTTGKGSLRAGRCTVSGPSWTAGSASTGQSQGRPRGLPKFLAAAVMQWSRWLTPLGPTLCGAPTWRWKLVGVA